MRKRVQFTPIRLRNWELKGRGTGTFSRYQPWHQVTRGDPASKGRSHILNVAFLGRQVHLLSDNELEVFGFICMLPDVIDIREQYPLSLRTHPIERAAYNASEIGKSGIGTLEIAAAIGYKHPTVRNEGDIEYWRLSTDFAVTRRVEVNVRKIMAISAKYETKVLTKRAYQRQEVDKLYWESQGDDWLFITPELSSRSVRMAVRNALPWAIASHISEVVSTDQLQQCGALKSLLDGTTLTQCIAIISASLEITPEEAKRAFWQSVWKGILPIELNHQLWRNLPIRFLSSSAFWEQNPIASGRTAWY